MTCYSTEGKKH